MNFSLIIIYDLIYEHSCKKQSEHLRSIPRHGAVLHPLLQDDGGADLIDHTLVLTAALLAYTTVEDDLMSQDGGEALIDQLDRKLRTKLAQTVEEWFDVSPRLTHLAVHLLGQADDDALDLLLGQIIKDELLQQVRSNRGEPVGNDLKWIGDGQAGALATVIYAEYS